MTLQTSVAALQGFGVPGEIFLDGPTRAQPGIIDSVGTSPTNTVGRVFTGVAAAEGHCTVGGSGIFYGILANPKVYPLRGTTGDTLAPSLNLPRYAEGEFVYDTTGIVVSLPAAANIGDLVDYVAADGTLATRPKAISATGSLAASAGAGALNVQTISAVAAGSALIVPGSVLSGAGTTPGAIVIAQLSGTTGVAGTYSVECNLLASASSGAVTGDSSPATGNVRVPGFEVVRYNIPSAGLAVVGNIN